MEESKHKSSFQVIVSPSDLGHRTREMLRGLGPEAGGRHKR